MSTWPVTDAVGMDRRAARKIAGRIEAALGVEPGDPGEWHVELLARPNAPGLPTVGIWRAGGEEWSAVVKVLRHADAGPTSGLQWSSHVEPDHPYYWKREALAFESVLLPGLEGGIRAPYCYGVTTGADGSIAVWMEDMGRTDAEAGTWSPERYGVAARQLGVAQGRLAGSEQLTEDWLSRGYLRTYVERRQSSPGADQDTAVWRLPAVRAALPAGCAEEFRRLWSDRGRVLKEVEALPQTFSHLDLHPRNMFGGASPDGGSGPHRPGPPTPAGTVLIDWAFAGVGGIGEDVSTLLIDAVTDFHLTPRRLPELFDVLAGGYTAGLAEGGLPLGEADVRRAIAFGATARYFWLPAALARALADGRPTINGRSAAEAVPYWASACEFLLELADLTR